MMRQSSLPVAAVESLLEQIMPGGSGLVPIAGGLESHAYRFQNAGTRYILRLNSSSEGFAKDAFAHERFTQPGLVIPTVFSIGTASDGLFYCLSAELPGITLQDLPASELARLLAPAAAVMNRIAGSDLRGTVGYG